MALSRLEAQVRRSAIVGGIVGGILIMVIARIMLQGSWANHHEARLPLIGNISGWPWYMRSYLPLDLLEVMVAFGAFLYLLATLHKITEVHGTRGWSMFGLWVFVGIGSLGSMMLSATDGWVYGLFGFLILPVMYIIFFAVLLAVGIAMVAAVSLVAGLGYLARNTCVGQWSRYWFKQLRRFLAAEDIPEEGPEHV